MISQHRDSEYRQPITSHSWAINFDRKTHSAFLQNIENMKQLEYLPIGSILEAEAFAKHVIQSILVFTEPPIYDTDQEDYASIKARLVHVLSGSFNFKAFLASADYFEFKRYFSNESYALCRFRKLVFCTRDVEM